MVILNSADRTVGEHPDNGRGAIRERAGDHRNAAFTASYPLNCFKQTFRTPCPDTRITWTVHGLKIVADLNYVATRVIKKGPASTPGFFYAP